MSQQQKTQFLKEHYRVLGKNMIVYLPKSPKNPGFSRLMKYNDILDTFLKNIIVFYGKEQLCNSFEVSKVDFWLGKVTKMKHNHMSKNTIV